MSKNHSGTVCTRCSGKYQSYLRREKIPDAEQPLPLSRVCVHHGRVKVCRISGDRRLCARMADLGILPGREMELLCSGGGGHHCMVRINGGTISLDSLTTANILVTPV